MPIDTSMYSQLRPVQMDNPTDVAQKAMTLGSLARQNQMQEQTFKDQQALRQAFQKNVVADANGKPTVNRQGVLADLAQSNPQSAVEMQGQFQKMDAEQLHQQTQMAKELAFSATPENWGQLKQKAVQLGMNNADKLPDQFNPMFVKRWQMSTLSGEEQVKNRMQQQALDYKRQEVAIARDKQSGEKIDKLAKDLRADLDPDRSRAGNFGQISSKYQSGERMKTLVGAFKDGNLPAAQVEELALGLANMVSGANGGAARAQVEALVPHSAMGDAQKFKSWLMNEPYGANQQKFVEMMSHTIDREMDTAQGQLNEIRVKRLTAHERLKKTAPDQYNRILEGYGIDPKNPSAGKKQGGDFHSMSDDDLDKAYRAAGGQ